MSKASVTRNEELLLRALLQYQYLTARQLQIAANQQSYRKTQLRLQHLVALKYMIPIHRRTTEQNLPLGFAYRPTGSAVSFLAANDSVTLFPRQPSTYFLDHTLAINDVLIALEKLCEKYPQHYVIRSMQHDLVLKRTYPQLITRPDTYVDIELVEKRQSLPLFLEIDMAEESERQWVEKIDRYVKLFDSQLEEIFQTDSITVAAIAPSNKRRDELKHWTEETLKRLKRRSLGENFFFGVLPKPKEEEKGKQTREEVSAYRKRADASEKLFHFQKNILPEALFLQQVYTVAFRESGLFLFDV